MYIGLIMGMSYIRLTSSYSIQAKHVGIKKCYKNSLCPYQSSSLFTQVKVQRQNQQRQHQLKVIYVFSIDLFFKFFISPFVLIFYNKSTVEYYHMVCMNHKNNVLWVKTNGKQFMTQDWLRKTLTLKHSWINKSLKANFEKFCKQEKFTVIYEYK